MCAIIDRWNHGLGGISPWFAAFGLAGALSLSGCGGGGGGGGGAVAVRQPAPPRCASTTSALTASTPTGACIPGWEPKAPTTAWPSTPFLFTGTDSDGWGKYVDIAMDVTQSTMQFLIIRPTSATAAVKDCPNNQQASLSSALAKAGQEIWVVSGDCTVYAQEPGKVRFGSARAVWLASDTIVWPGASASNGYQLLAAANGGVTSSSSGISGYDNHYALSVDPAGFAGLPSALQMKVSVVRRGDRVEGGDAIHVVADRKSVDR